MTAPKPRQDTVRIIDWDELPERARNLPNNLNPFEEGVFTWYLRRVPRILKTMSFTDMVMVLLR